MPGNLESYFGLSVEQLFQVILDNPRCLMNVKGAVAEAHLRLLLDGLKEEGVISGFTIGGEGKPDFAVAYAKRAILIECKNVEKAKNRANQQSLVSVTIDFKKTRNQLGGKHLRYYRRDEFDIVAACLFNRTNEWRFVYARTATFAEHPDFPGLGHLHDKLLVMRDGELLPHWTPDLAALLTTF